MPSLIETLESRQLFAVSPPTDAEQYLIELINRARNDPVATAVGLGINLNEGLTTNAIVAGIRQPLAVSGLLTDSAQRQARFLRATAQVSLVGPLGNTPADRITGAGYPAGGTLQSSYEAVTARFPQGAAPGGGGTPGAGLPTRDDVDQIFRNLFIDAANTGRLNRVNLFNGTYREVGTGLNAGPFGQAGPGGGGGGGGVQAVVGVVDLARTNGNLAGDLFLTGVAYNDADTDLFYSPGEGLNGVTVTARRISDNQTFTTTTFDSGGYSLRLPTGTYDVIAQGGELGVDALGQPAAVRYTSVVVGGGSGSADDRNVKRDFTLAQAGPAIPPPGPIVPPGPSPATLSGDVQGKVFFDRRGDGRREGLRFDNVVVDVRVFVDANDDGLLTAGETFGVVQDRGTYTIPGLAPGLYTLRVDAPAGFRVSVPDEGFRRVQVSSGRLTRVGNFAITNRTVISGRVYRDDNINGQFDAGFDRGLRGFRVYLDLNGDGIWQRETEPARVSSSAGTYAFRDVLAGVYTVRVIPRVAYLQTEPPVTPATPIISGAYVVQIPDNGNNVINRDFGERLIG